MKETNYGTFNPDGFVWRREKGRGLGMDGNIEVKKITCREDFLVKFVMLFNRLGVAGAVLQTLPLHID